MLFNRYFGSKKKLFEEVVESTLAVPGILHNEIAKSDDDMTRLFLVIAPSTRERSPLDDILLRIRSASNPQAAPSPRSATGLLKPAPKTREIESLSPRIFFL